MKKTERIDIRLSKPDKDKCEQVLKDINETRNKKVGYRFLLMEFVNNYLDNKTSGLQIKKESILKKIDKEKENEAKAKHNISLLEIELNNINNEINNKSLFDISNYQYDKPLNKGFNRLKEIVLNPDNKINSFEDINETTFKQMQESFNIKDLELFKKIVKNHFREWKQEKIINDPTPEPTKQEIIKDISEKMLIKFNRPIQPIKNLNEYLNQNETKLIIKGYLKDKSEINENEIINYMLENIPEKQQHK